MKHNFNEIELVMRDECIYFNADIGIEGIFKPFIIEIKGMYPTECEFLVMSMKKEVFKIQASTMTDLFQSLIEFFQKERDKALEELMKDSDQ